MTSPFQSFNTIVTNSAAAVQATAGRILDFSTGSVIRALLEANSSVAFWMQWLVVRGLRASRAATSAGADLDSWMADFSMVRLPPVLASGVVTFSRYSAQNSVSIPVGTLVKTGDGSQGYSVTADIGNASWDSSKGAYVMGPGVTMVDAPVIAHTPGIAGNVQAGTITMISAPLPGVDQVSNRLITGGGIDAETDSAFKERFRLYINSLGKATRLAVENAICSVQQGLLFQILENSITGSDNRPGHFLIVVDDGSGSPSTALITSVAAAVDKIRPIGTVFTVQAASVRRVGIKCTITAVSAPAVAATSVKQAITDFVNALPLGASLPITRIAQVAYDCSDTIANVSNLRLDDGIIDVVVGQNTLIRVGDIVVSS